MTDTVPMMLEHCVRVYGAMDGEAHDEIDVQDVEGDTGDEDNPAPTIRVYDGHLTKIFSQLELAAPYYTSVMKHLKSMGCVEQIRRGGGAQTSRWQLIKPPEADDFSTDHSNKSTTLRQRVKILEQEVLKLRHNQDVITHHFGIRL